MLIVTSGREIGMVQIRLLNSNGIQEFKSYLAALREGKRIMRPNLNDAEYSTPYPKECVVDENKSFRSKFELGLYISLLFEHSGISREEATANTGLWSWMGFAFFETLTIGLSNNLKLGEDYRYIYSEDYRNRYRHLIWLPYDMITLHGASASRLFLYRQLNVQGDFIEQIVSRNELYSSKGVVETATALYYDTHTDSGKKGAQSKVRKGNLRRYISVLDQLGLTYDLYTMSADGLLSLLPDEFDHWKS